MAPRVMAAVALLVASSNGYVLAPTCSRPSSRTSTTEMVLSRPLVAAVGTAAVGGVIIATKKFLPKKEDPAVAAFRSSLSGMETLSGLAEMKLERGGPRWAHRRRVEGVRQIKRPQMVLQH